MVIVRGIVKALIVTAGLLAATLALAAPPEWITGNPSAYPATAYLTGRGAGATEEEAQNRARGDLAAIFEVRVRMVSGNTTTVIGSASKEQIHKMVTQQVFASTDKVISGIVIAEIWRDPETAEYHALAVLSRARAAAGLREAIGELDDGIQMEMNAANTTGDPLRKLAALSRAMQAAIRRDAFQASLKIVGSSGRGIPPPIAQPEIQAQIDEALQRIRIAPVLSTEAANDAPEKDGTENDDKEFENILKSGLAAAGFAAENPGNADFRLAARLTLNEAELRNNWYWMRGTVEISLSEEKTGRVRGGKTWPVKVSARDVRTVHARMLMEIEKLFRQSLRAAIIEFATGS